MGDNLSCGACPGDARCTLAACRTFKACGGQLLAEPSPGVCDGAPDLPDAGVELAEYCPDACTAQTAGALLEQGCLPDGGLDVPDAGSESADAGSDAGTCGACAVTRATCESGCSRNTRRECLDCAADCAIDALRCAQTCR